MKISKLVLSVYCFFISFFSFSQEKININDIEREWKLDFVEKNGKVRNAEDSEKNESIIFYKNNKFKLIDSEQDLKGIWHFDYLKRTMILNLVEMGQKIKLRIISLSKTELTYVYEDVDKKLIYHFK